MKYSLYKDVIPEYTAKEQILYNRGIPRDKQESWLSAGWDDIYDWTALGIDLMEQACVELANAVTENQDIVIIVDADCDGYTSSAILINYLYKTYPEYTSTHVSYIHHQGKQHGFADVMEQILEKNPALVISPDGGR